MLRYGQFCPVAQAAEIFADRWTPQILRELCFGACTFGDLLFAVPFISRTMLAQRLKELAAAEVVVIEPKTRGRGHLYRLTAAGEDFRPLIEMLSVWGQRWFQGRLGPDDLDPGLLMYGMQRQIDPAGIPPGPYGHPFRVPRPLEGLPRQGVLVVRDRASRGRCVPQGSGFRCRCCRPGGPCCLHQNLAWLCRPERNHRPRQSRLPWQRARHHPLSRLMRLPERPTLKQFKFAPFPADGGVHETERALVSA
jgi:DNA-binding HxlR family transcriptional regulator